MLLPIDEYNLVGSVHPREITIERETTCPLYNRTLGGKKLQWHVS
jgi:hypothetical protein